MAKAYTFTDLATPVNVQTTISAGGGLDASTTYYYRVVAVFGASPNTPRLESGRSLASIEVSQTTDVTNKTINLTWDAVTGAGGYRLYRSKSLGLYGTCLNTCILTNSYSDSNAHPSTWSTTKFWDKPHGKLDFSGGTEADPVTIEDLYAQDQANGWGVINKPIDGVYEINTHLRVADYFEAKACTLIFNYTVYAPSVTVFTFGEKKSDDSSYNGCNIVLRLVDGYNLIYYRPIMNFYACKLYNDFQYWNGYGDFSSPELYYGKYQAIEVSGGILQDSSFDRLRYIMLKGSVNVKNIIASAMQEGIWNPTTTGTIDGLKVVASSSAIQQSTYSIMTIRGLTLFDNSYDMRMYYPSTGYAILTNSEIDKDKIRWINTPPDSTSYIDEYFTFKLKVVDNNGDPITGVSVKICNLDGSEISGSPFTTDSNGEIDEQDLYYVRHTCGEFSVQTFSTIHTYHSPHTVTMTKTGYKTRVMPYTMDKKRDEVEKLMPQVDVIITKGQAYKNIDPEDEQNEIFV